MAYRSELDVICSEINEAKTEVVAAHRSRDVNKINKADRKLADLHAQYRECSGGRIIPDDR
jgi:hypothetical protein